MTGDPYVYPKTVILRNKPGIRDAKLLDQLERQVSTQRAAEGVPTGDFDLKHLRAIHRHLFQDIYDWAGEVRTVEIAKEGHQFQFRNYIENGMADIHRRIVARNYLRLLTADDFAAEAGPILGDVNYVHPFREGNGRTQMLYLQQLASQAGHALDLLRVERSSWMGASRRAHQADYAPMSACIADAIKQKGGTTAPP